MKKTKVTEAEEISFEEISAEWIALKMGAEKFVMDTDTLIDLSFRCASFLAYLEHKEQEQELESTETQFLH